ncbi:membrane-spanning 4-domains subfamily A member 4A-like [Rhinophrynus dorsalis]
MTTFQSDAGSFVIISQVSPQRAQADTSTECPNPKSTVPKPLIKFYKGEPLALAMTQLFIGILHIILGIAITVSSTGRHWDFLIYTGLPFWSGIMYTISGSLSVAASCKPALGKIRASLILNILSSIAAGVACIIFVLELLFSHSFYWHRRSVFCAVYAPVPKCEGSFHIETLVTGVMSLLIIFTILELCISISTSAFACKVVCRTSFTETSVVIYQSAAVNAAAPVSTITLPSDDDVKNQ